MSATLETIRQMIAEEFQLDHAIVTADATLESLEIDSLSAIEFMFLLEDRFKIDFPEDKAKIKTVGDIAIELDKAIGAPSDERKALARS